MSNTSQQCLYHIRKLVRLNQGQFLIIGLPKIYTNSNVESVQKLRNVASICHEHEHNLVLGWGGGVNFSPPIF